MNDRHTASHEKYEDASKEKNAIGRKPMQDSRDFREVKADHY
jgi:hypothetical protein